ncbi:MAG: NusG domain II-containing protein [Bacteroidetes bacterium]|nr:NusG domain II-containing protein [Bacteroidota bacterium]
MMIRREFLRRGVATVAGISAAAAGVPGALAAGRSPRMPLESFSLDVVTDRPAEAVSALGSFLADNRLSAGTVKVEMHPLVGRHVGDVVYVADTSLIDFRVRDGRVEQFLRSLAREYELPRQMVDPTIVRFSAGATGKASEVQLFAGDLMLAREQLRSGGFERTVSSANGEVTVKADDSGVRIIKASCKHQTCVKAGAIHRAGESLVCIPGRIRVVLSGQPSPDADFILSQ